MLATNKVAEFVPRPGTGKIGSALTVRTNYFLMDKVPDRVIYHFDVTITPEATPAMNRRVFERMLDVNQADFDGARPVFDGRKSVFLPKKLAFDARVFEVSMSESMSTTAVVQPVSRSARSFVVKMRQVATINLHELLRFLEGKTCTANNIQTCIMAMDILIRNKPAKLFATVGRSFFLPEGATCISGGIEVWHGYHQSARPAATRMAIKIDISATTFYPHTNLLEFLCSSSGLQPDDLRCGLDSSILIRWERLIKGLRITLTHREKQGDKRSFKITGITRTNANETTFQRVHPSSASQNQQHASTEKISVTKYMQDAYGYRLKSPFMPCIVVGKGQMLPLELCMIEPGQRYTRKLDDRQTADMIKVTSAPPQIRSNKITRGLRVFNYPDNEDLQAWGLEITDEMLKVNARVLPAPAITYSYEGRNSRVIPQDGVWSMKNRQFHTASKLSCWGVIVMGSERNMPVTEVQSFLRELFATCQDTGIDVIGKNPYKKYCNPHGDVEGQLREAWQMVGDMQNRKPELLLIFLPNTGRQLYAEVKRVTDTLLGVASQCVQMKQALRKGSKAAYCANLVLKINAKLGGTNAIISEDQIPFLGKPTIIMGADVSHPAPGEDNKPSIAAVVGSIDRWGIRHASSVRAQAARTEMIADLAGMTKELLKAFFTSTKVKPQQILFYRDGVAEGQFKQIMENEVDAIRAACRELQSDYKPKITFIVVQKRHHTRFFPVHEADGDRRSGNCRPGTVIDTGIVHPFEFDFFLQSHAGLLGTSRPAHYHVLVDECKLTPDEVQIMTYRLCHLYARCTRSVSLVPSAYYAHLVAARARYHTRTGEYNSHESPLSQQHPLPASTNELVPVKNGLNSVMWFV